MSKINARSPYFIHYTGTLLTSVSLDIDIYTGSSTNYPSEPTYTLSSSGVNDEVTFEISELVRDYLDSTFDGTYNSENVWVRYIATKVLNDVAQTPETQVVLRAYDGYGEFEDGANPQLDQQILLSNTVIVSNDYDPINIPVDANTEDVTLNYYSNGSIVYTDTKTAINDSESIIQYSTNSVGDIDTFKSRVLADGGVFEAKECVEAIYDDHYKTLDVDYVQVITASGDIQILTVKEVEECKYDTYKVVFKNKLGAWQDLWFFKRSDLSMKTKAETYKSNLVVAGSYDTNRHQKRVFLKNGMQSLKLNTGFYPEEYNQVFKEFMLSESVYITYENQNLPINVKSSDIEYKEKVNEKLINYTIDVEFAYNTINNIR